MLFFSTSCVSSPFPCDWCVDGHRCTHDTAENCRNDILVTGIKRVGPSIRSGFTFNFFRGVISIKLFTKASLN